MNWLIQHEVVVAILHLEVVDHNSLLPSLNKLESLMVTSYFQCNDNVNVNLENVLFDYQITEGSYNLINVWQ